LYAFGHGLSYTRFYYQQPKLVKSTVTTNETIRLEFTLQNVGDADGDEVSQVYFRHVHSPVPQPRMALCNFTRIHLSHDSSARISVEIPVERLRDWDTITKQYVVEPGKYELMLGGASDDIRLRVPFKVKL